MPWKGLVVQPILNAPLSNLDANLRLEMRRLVRSLQQELGITTIFVTHDQEEAVMLADRVALMMEGRLLQYDEARSFYERPCSPAVARFFRNENFLPGTKHGATVDTALGAIRAPHAARLADGRVLITVRPEHSEIVCGMEANCVRAEVRAVTYMGTYTWVEATIGEHPWAIAAPPHQAPAPGAVVCLKLPEAHVWVTPTTEA